MSKNTMGLVPDNGKVLDIENMFIKPSMSLQEINAYTSHIVGLVKTLIDASVIDVRQNKALKDLLGQQIWGACNEVENWAQEEREGKGRSFPFLNQLRPEIL